MLAVLHGFFLRWEKWFTFVGLLLAIIAKPLLRFSLILRA